MNKKLLPITFSILFIVSCGGGGGGGGGSAPTPTTPTPTVNLSADPISVLVDNTSTLTWSSTNATSCSASWTSQTSISGSEAVTISTVGDNSFSISCTGDGGSRSTSVTVEGIVQTCVHNDVYVVYSIDELQNYLDSYGGDGIDDTIYLGAGEYMLDEELQYDAGGTEEKITIKGCARDDVILNGQGKTRILYFKKNGGIDWESSDEPNWDEINSAPFPILHLENLTLSNGYCSEEQGCSRYGGPGGGGLYAEAFDAEINNVHFLANSSNCLGGAIGGVINLNVLESKFSYNNSGCGGSAMMYAENLLINDSIFTANGGASAIWHNDKGSSADCPKSIIQNSSFADNRRIFGSTEHTSCSFNESLIDHEYLTIKDSNFTNNSGPAVVMRGYNLFIDNITVSGHTGGYSETETDGCDGNNDEPEKTGHDWDCTWGGVIGYDKFSGGYGRIEIVNSNFTNNSADDFGGVVDMLGNVRCDEAEYERYTAGCDKELNSSVSAYDLIVRDSVFEQNTSHRGAVFSVAKRRLGGADGYQLGNIKIVNSLFKNNTGLASEGSDYVPINEDLQTSIISSGGNLDIENSSFENNQADIILDAKGELICDYSCNNIND